MRLRENAICIKTTDWSETSQVLHFLTRTWGVARVLAKGTKRPKSKTGGAVDLLAEGELIFSASSRDTLGTLMEFTETFVHTDLRRDALRLNTALYLIELVGEMLAEADPHVEVFDLLHSALARMGQTDAPVPAVLAYFQWRLLGHVGLLGELQCCVSCGQEIIAPKAAPAANAAESGEIKPESGQVYFSSTQGGLLCRNCEPAATEKYLVDRETLAGIAVLLAVESGARAPLPDVQARRVSRLLSYHITHQLGKQLRMAKHAIR